MAKLLTRLFPARMKFPVEKTAQEWKNILSDEEYEVIRNKGTERPGAQSEYYQFDPGFGYFACRACENPIYSAAAKFHSGCGWPAFDKCYAGSVVTNEDKSGGRIRTEIVCSVCGGHLGHVFSGERFTDTNERHCVNSLSVRYHSTELSAPKVEEPVLR